MSDNSLPELAEQVSVLMQLDRMRHHVGTQVDMKVLGNVPDHIASVFEQANAVGSSLTPEAAYALINKRVSHIQAQLYLMRLEMENRDARDPARIYDDPLAISAYGERMEGIATTPKSFDFGPGLLAHGWYPMETGTGGIHRWMRPGDVSVACVPHLGAVDQVIEITGYVMHPEQMDGLEIAAAGKRAQIEITEAGPPARFRARLEVSEKDVTSANYLAIEFRMADFRTPNDMDTRMLGANVGGFTCRPAREDERESAPEKPSA